METKVTKTIDLATNRILFILTSYILVCGFSYSGWCLSNSSNQSTIEYNNLMILSEKDCIRFVKKGEFLSDKNETLSILKRVLNHPSKKVRWQAAQSLSYLGDDNGVRVNLENFDGVGCRSEYDNSPDALFSWSFLFRPKIIYDVLSEIEKIHIKNAQMDCFVQYWTPPITTNVWEWMVKWIQKKQYVSPYLIRLIYSLPRREGFNVILDKLANEPKPRIGNAILDHPCAYNPYLEWLPLARNSFKELIDQNPRSASLYLLGAGGKEEVTLLLHYLERKPSLVDDTTFVDVLMCISGLPQTELDNSGKLNISKFKKWWSKSKIRHNSVTARLNYIREELRVFRLIREHDKFVNWDALSGVSKIASAARYIIIHGSESEKELLIKCISDDFSLERDPRFPIALDFLDKGNLIIRKMMIDYGKMIARQRTKHQLDIACQIIWILKDTSLGVAASWYMPDWRERELRRWIIHELSNVQ